MNTRSFMLSFVSIYVRLKMESRSYLRSCKLWNNLPLEIRRKDSLPAFKKSLWNSIFKEQLSLNHFHI